MTDTENKAAERFADDVTDHQMTVLLDQGLYRHLRFKKPGTSMYWFDILTWPGALVIRGDMGTYVFVRLEDMLEFFGGGRINAMYWAEKVVAGKDQIERYSEQVVRDLVEQRIADHIDAEGLDAEEAAELRAAVRSEVLTYADEDEQAVRLALGRFRHGGFTFYDVWEMDLTDYTHQYLWCLHAITYAVRAYRAAQSAAQESASVGAEVPV